LDRYSTDSEPDGDTVQLWLPGIGKDAEPSPEAQKAGCKPLAGKVLLLSWQLTVITLKAADAVDFLVQLPEPHQLPAGFALGAAVSFWKNAPLRAISRRVEQLFPPAREPRGPPSGAYGNPQPGAGPLPQFSPAIPGGGGGMPVFEKNPPQAQA